VNLTNYHAKYLAHELTRRAAAGTVEGIVNVLADARVDLNPHQVEAALFASQNPFSKGVILADETGLGKTIEAGLLIAQKWAERKRKILVILPANLRKQWAQELYEKFSLPSTILETKTANQIIRGGTFNPFESENIVVCSYQFAHKSEHYVRSIAWDLIVIDEAHRLRNVYKGTSKIANSIKKSIEPFQKVLLTATPLQNSLLELYGLVSIIDEYHFGGLDSYKMQYTRSSMSDDTYGELKRRLAPICQRTLRSQVLQYIKYTNRNALVQEFVPSAPERRLYDGVSDFLQRDKLYSLPSGQRQLVTMVLRKLLASSTFAIAATLERMITRLEGVVTYSEKGDELVEAIAEDFEELDELADEWEDDDDSGETKKAKAKLTPEQVAELKLEIDELRGFADLARSIAKNAKGETLLTALRRGFDAANKARAGAVESGKLQQKAIIFTESRKTQQYLLDLLENSEFAGKAILFNGTNSDPKSKEIYHQWIERHQGTDKVSGSPSADMRAALVDYFRDEAQILIATEAASEGINLQFCNLIVNYDLPWNPQRIEQRIGRCHRYGQKYDVVVVNFINKENAADQRVYELLNEKFKLFDGVFGASDEVLGAVESGVDFERRIAEIYQQCRTPQQITFEFDKLQDELGLEIEQSQKVAREKLLNNFDADVVDRVKIDSGKALDKFNGRLWELTKYLLRDVASFSEDDHTFELKKNPFPDEAINSGPYRMGKAVDDVNNYRIGHPLAQRVLEMGEASSTPLASLAFDYGSADAKISVLEPLRGESGWLSCAIAKVDAIADEERIIFGGQLDIGTPMDPEQARRLFDLPAAVGTVTEPKEGVKKALDGLLAAEGASMQRDMESETGRWYEQESTKLERWAEDRRSALKALLDESEEAYKRAKKAAREAGTMPERLRLETEARKLDLKKDDALKEFEVSSREVRDQKNKLLDELGDRVQQRLTSTLLFTIRWSLK
jgi:superfamily II DNA or RNA helicase